MFADDNFLFDENGRKLSKRVENAVGEKEKLLVTRNFSFFPTLFSKRHVLQTSQKQGLCEKGLQDNTPLSFCDPLVPLIDEPMQHLWNVKEKNAEEEKERYSKQNGIWIQTCQVKVIFVS